MAQSRPLASLISVFWLAACGGTGAVPVAPGLPPPSGFSTLINAERTANALGPVASETRLTRAAQGHADDMSIRGYFGHVTPEGATLSDRVLATGYRFCWAAENIAQGYATPAAAFSAWMNSPGHRANMLSAQAAEFGLGYAPAGRTWVLVLAKPGC